MGFQRGTPFGTGLYTLRVAKVYTSLACLSLKALDLLRLVDCRVHAICWLFVRCIEAICQVMRLKSFICRAFVRPLQVLCHASRLTPPETAHILVLQAN
jgi:hypothetical protein